MGDVRDSMNSNKRSKHNRSKDIEKDYSASKQAILIGTWRQMYETKINLWGEINYKKIRKRIGSD